jgi:putative membrane protein
MVWFVSNLTDVNLGISNDLLTVLGTVLGLVISFRTTSAYERYVAECRRNVLPLSIDRYQEGPSMWTVIGAMSRSLAQMVCPIL